MKHKETTENGITYIQIEKAEYAALVHTVKDQAADINELKDCVTSVIKLMGLYDDKTKTIKASIADGTESYFKYIIKAVKDLLSLLVQSNMGFSSSKDELVEKFAFIKTVLPLIKKYA